MKPTIGLEIHVQLNTKTKLFCSDKNDSLETTPNKNICPVCMGHPGTLPVLNNEAVKKILRAGLALSCGINQFSKFDRKNYFYPDLPKGYQISQYDIPFCVAGKLALSSGETIRITRIHLEEDTGRLIHEGSASLIDFNRAGVPLMELVTEPDFNSSKDVVEFAKSLQILWRYLDISDADMERGQMRVEANISLNMGTKVEVKNLNSFKAAFDAIEYEIQRQKHVLEEGGKLVQETRGWDVVKSHTFSQRIKETAKDYRYFPEPDLPPVVITDKELSDIRASLPELPRERKSRFIKEYGLSLEHAEILINEKEMGEYFEEAASELAEWEADTAKPHVTKEHLPTLTRLCANYLITEFPRIAIEHGISREKLYNIITPENFAELIVLTHQGMVSSSGAQATLLEMAKTGLDPHEIIEKKGLKQVSDKHALTEIIKTIIEKNPKPVADYKKGKANALTFLVGQMMIKNINSSAVVTREILEELLKEE